MTETRKALERIILWVGLVIMGVLVCLLLLPTVWSYTSPFVVAFCLAAMLQPIVRFGMQKCKMRRGLASMAGLVLILLVALLILWWFLSFAVDQILSLVNNGPAIVQSLTQTVNSLLAMLTSKLEGLSPKTTEWLNNTLKNASQELYSGATRAIGVVFSGTFNFATKIPFVIIYLNFLLMGFVFISNRYDSILSKFPGGNPKTMVGEMRRSAVKGTIGYLKVQFIYGMIVLVVSWLYFQLMGFDYSVLIALTAAIFEFLPLLGSGTLYLPWAVVCVFLGWYPQTIKILALYAFFFLFRKITEPRIMHDNMGLSPLVSLLSMFVGLKIGGFMGLALSPIAAVVLTCMVRSGFFSQFLKDVKTLYQYLRTRLYSHSAP